MLGHVGQELGHAEVGDGLDGGRRPAVHGDRELGGHRAAGGERGQRAFQADVERGRMDAAGDVAQLGDGLLGAPVRRRRSVRGPGRDRRARRRPRASPSPCPGAWPSATSWAWVPSCRSRSMRRSVAAEASTVWVRACSSERTRAAIGSGPSSDCGSCCRSTFTKPRMTQGAAKKKTTPTTKPPTSRGNPPPFEVKSAAEEVHTSPQTGDPPRRARRGGA